MSAPTILASGLGGAIGCSVDSSKNRLVFVEFAGRISSIDLAASTVAALGTGYHQPEDIAVVASGASAFVAERAGDLLKVDLGNASRSAATTLASGLVAPQQIALFETAGLLWVIEYGTAGRLVQVNLANGAQTVLASGFDHATGLAASSDRSMAYVAEQAVTGGRITAIALPSGTRTTLIDGLVNPFFLSWLDPGEHALLVAERDPANRISLLDLASSPPVHRLVALGAGSRPSSARAAGTRLLVCTDSQILGYDLSAGLPSEVKLHFPTPSSYVGSYVRVAVDVTGTGVAFDDLDFAVPGGRRGGEVSLSRDSTFTPARPEIVLLAGYRRGTYVVRAIHKPSGTVAGEQKFALSDMWPDDNLGPARWFNGIIPSYAPGPTWGGGPAGSPQNYNTIPALGTKRVAVLFVDTADQRYTTDAPTLAGFRARWQQNAFDGVVGADGTSRSVRRYYREVSYQTLGLPGMPGLDIAGTVFPNVVTLPGRWGDYFQVDSNGAWQAKGEFVDQCITAAGDGVNLTGFDMIVCVSQSVSAAAPAKVAWPYGGYGVNVDSSHGRVTSRGISMPNEWGDGSALDQGGGRTIYETLAHEMGHTINLPDEYTPGVAGRNLAGNPAGASWDPMDLETTLPHLTLPHRLMLGWLQPGWIKLYNFQGAPGTTVDDTVTLSAVESGPPPAGQLLGLEIRVGDGRNYYAEYRTGQTAGIGDEQLVPNARVVVVDVSEPPDPPVISRPDMLLVPQHADDNGGVLDAGQFYHEVDTTTPTFPSDFRLDLVSRSGNQAVVRVRYGVIGKPDPSIRPWPRDPAHQWQSPDIDVNNARNAADPAWANVPWSGHNNTVVAHITNRGSLSAPGVVAELYVKDYTVSSAPETLLGSDTQDIPPGATVDFTSSWTPPAPARPGDAQHFCIIVRIPHYQTPTTPPVQEMTDANNVAQSNYDRFISATSVPSREATQITVRNPYDRPTRFFISGGQSNPLYRTYLEHAWLRLGPGESRKVLAMFEFAPDAEQSDPKVSQFKEKYLRLPNFFTAVGSIEDPHDPRLHGPKRVSGVSAEIVTGKSTRFREVKVSDRDVVGQVITDEGQPVTGGNVVVTERSGDGRELTAHRAPIQQQGRFQAVLLDRPRTIELYYVGSVGYADSETVGNGPTE